MLFTPHYTVSYKGAFHPAGKAFPIDPADADMMAAHGVVEKPVKPVEPPTEPPKVVEVSAPPEPEKPARKAGRPRKAVSA